MTEDAASDAAASEADDAATGAEADDAATDEGAAAPPPAPPLRLLVTNDDGYDSEGIDLVVSALAALDDVEITVVAPLENQSGSSDTRSDTPPTATDETTASGYPVIAVAGTPADAVIYALENVFDDGHPDLIVSGANDGQNVGPLASISGTVGAARTGAREGIPGFAVSVAGITVVPGLDAAIRFVVGGLSYSGSRCWPPTRRRRRSGASTSPPVRATEKSGASWKCRSPSSSQRASHSRSTASRPSKSPTMTRLHCRTGSPR